jgi:hypothetical protein
MTTLAILAAPFALALLMLVARHARRRDPEPDRKRLEAIDERRAAANLYAPEQRPDVAPQHAPNTAPRRHE